MGNRYPAVTWSTKEVRTAWSTAADTLEDRVDRNPWGLNDSFSEYVPIPAKNGSARNYSERQHRSFRSRIGLKRLTLIVVELVRISAVQHLEKLHNVRVGDISLKLISSAVET
jgi:hypothetical protein